MTRQLGGIIGQKYCVPYQPESVSEALDKRPR